MFDEYDLAIVKNDIAFEKAYNEFEILNEMTYFTESDNDQEEKSAKSNNAFKKVISSIMKVINSLIDKIGSVIDNFKKKIIKKDAKIEVAEDPKESARNCEEIRKKATSSIEKIKSAKTPEACDKVMEDWESQVDKKKKSSLKKKAAKTIIITAGAALTAFTAIQTSLRLSYKDAAKQLDSLGRDMRRDEVEFVNKKEKLITNIMSTLKGVLMDEINIPANINNMLHDSGVMDLSADNDYNIARRMKKDAFYNDKSTGGLSSKERNNKVKKLNSLWR